MLTLDLDRTPRWHDLASGVRVQLRPLTTALMVATRSDPAVEAVPEEASDEERAVAFAKALARRAVLAWEGSVEVAQSVLAETQTAILPLVPYLDTLRWVFIAVALVGIVVTIYARLDDWKRGRR